MNEKPTRVRVRIIGEMTTLDLRPEIAEELVKQGIAEYATEKRIETQMIQPQERRG